MVRQEDIGSPAGENDDGVDVDRIEARASRLCREKRATASMCTVGDSSPGTDKSLIRVRNQASQVVGIRMQK
jgi:hypothetical protein